MNAEIAGQTAISLPRTLAVVAVCTCAPSAALALLTLSAFDKPFASGLLTGAVRSADQT